MAGRAAYPRRGSVYRIEVAQPEGGLSPFAPRKDVLSRSERRQCYPLYLR